MRAHKHIWITNQLFIINVCLLSFCCPCFWLTNWRSCFWLWCSSSTSSHMHEKQVNPSSVAITSAIHTTLPWIINVADQFWKSNGITSNIWHSSWVYKHWTVPQYIGLLAVSRLDVCSGQALRFALRWPVCIKAFYETGQTWMIPIYYLFTQSEPCCPVPEGI